MTNPHKEECLNHMLPEFKEARLLFMVEGKTDEEAAALLSNLWDFNNNKAKLEEEQKKYKKEISPIPNRPLQTTSLLLPLQHALNKLCKGEYIPLYFFTNKGIREAEDDGSRDEDLLTLIQIDKGPMFQMAASAKAKKHMVRDKHLTWEEFSQANYCMITMMKQQEWPDEQISMI
ncbi:hypothetical protein PAXRUDRAFT_17927 [Paxillus rubicundulus Ve08.2h10]|uniref:Uncharacterized protein n=1 Tax=Paxillus rubicundulus Ve08.2h10 TaxID=930991 RepID=A0A0D0CNF7_9AGAM|nr:hypothetical protein PAXRUDRAFT_17927 [Paxillus rubicundulus Ve08.2h10]